MKNKRGKKSKTSKAMKPIQLTGYAVYGEHPLQNDIGKQIKFKNPNTPYQHSGSFTIVGIQHIYTGQIAYRVTANAKEYGDNQFGSPALPDEVEFI